MSGVEVVGFVLAAQQAARQRIIGDDAEALLRGERQQLALDLAEQQTVARLDGDRATAIFRIFQECLTNVARHAEARAVRASLSKQDE